MPSSSAAPRLMRAVPMARHCSRDAGCTPSRSSCPRPSGSFTTNSMSISWTALPWPGSRVTKAMHRTLRRRLIALTVQEGLMHDAHLDIDARDAAFAEARALIRHEFNLGEDRLAAVEAERILADMKRRLLKNMSDEELALVSSEYTSETAATASEDVAMTAVALCLPEERQRIRTLLARHPWQTETKAQKLLHALGTLWKQDPTERVVLFATYLGTVEMLSEEIDKAYPGQ